MNLKTVLQKLQALGVELAAVGSHLDIKNTSALSSKQLEWIARHRAEILAELKGESTTTPEARLEPLARRYEVPLEELLAWYKEDLEDIAAMPEEALERLVADYASLRSWYQAGMPDGLVAEPKVQKKRGKCQDCKHFQRASHPNLGHCAKGHPEAPAGLWSKASPSCGHWTPGAAWSLSDGELDAKRP